MRKSGSVIAVLCVVGACASTNGGRPDARASDSGDGSDAAALDDATTDGVLDDGMLPTDGMIDAMTDAPADAMMTGPVAIGAYTYTAVNASGLISPPAVAWHPSGSYALVLNYSDKVYRYDPVAHTLTQVATAGSTVRWRTVVFAPGGETAVLLANVTSPAEGRVYLWSNATQQVTQMTTETFAGGTYEGIAWSQDGLKARLLGAKPNSSTYLAYLWAFDVTAGRSDLKAKATSAGCQDLAWATDAFDLPAVAVTCGLNGVTLFHLDGNGNFVDYTLNAGNTSRISPHPSGTYALAIGWSGQRVYRYQQGNWSTAFANPTFPGIFAVRFSTSGTRALMYGSAGSGVARAFEFRNDLFTQADITEVSIPNFSLAPYNASSSAQLNDAAWHPGCDGGLIVGGSNTLSSQQAFVIRFSVDNGVPCANN